MAAFGMSGHWKNVMPLVMKAPDELGITPDDDAPAQAAPMHTDSLGVDIPSEYQMLANLMNRAYMDKTGKVIGLLFFCFYLHKVATRLSHQGFSPRRFSRFLIVKLD